MRINGDLRLAFLRFGTDSDAWICQMGFRPKFCEILFEWPIQIGGETAAAIASVVLLRRHAAGLDRKLRRLDFRYACQCSQGDAEGHDDMRRFDRREPSLDVAVFGHELRRT